MKSLLLLLFIVPVLTFAQVKTDPSLKGKNLNEIEELVAGNWAVSKIKIDTVDGYEEIFTDVEYQFTTDRKSKLLVGNLGRPSVSEGTWKIIKEENDLYLVFNMEWGVTKHKIIFVDDTNFQFHETREGWKTGNIYYLTK